MVVEEAHKTYEKPQKGDNTRLNKAQAVRAYARLQTLASCFEEEDAFFGKYVSVAPNFLKQFPIEECKETLEAHIPDPQDVCEVMAPVLPDPLTVFTDEFYIHETFPIKILYRIAEVHGFSERDE